MNRDDVDFRSVHYFTDFDTFDLDTAAEARAKLDRDARRRAVYLWQSSALLSTLATFSPQHTLAPRLLALLQNRFTTVQTLTFAGTPNGDYTDTLTRYQPRPQPPGG
jgi:hypothetical protein